MRLFGVSRMAPCARITKDMLKELYGDRMHSEETVAIRTSKTNISFILWVLLKEVQENVICSITLETRTSSKYGQGKYRKYSIQRRTIPGEHGSVVVKALCYKPEGRGFETPMR
jgi:hypothetical protein